MDSTTFGKEDTERKFKSKKAKLGKGKTMEEFSQDV